MNRFKKVISLLITLTLFVATLSGCSVPEKAVYDAMLKSADITSMEQEVHFSWNVEASGLSLEEQEQMNQTLAMINGSDLTFKQAVIASEDGQKSKAQMDVVFNMGGTLTNVGLWVDVDMTENANKIYEIIQVPPMMTYYLPEEYMGKEYIVFDFDDMETFMSDQDLGTFQFNEMMQSSQVLSEKAQDFVTAYIKEFNFKRDLVTYKGTEKVENDTLQIYEVKLDDETTKELLHYTLLSLINSEATDEFMKDYFKSVDDMMLSMGMEEDLQGEFTGESLYNDFISEKETLKMDIHKLFADISDIQIVGDEGIIVELKINDEGYLVGTTTNIHLSIDPNAFNEQYGYTASMYDIQEPTFDIKLAIDSVITNINEDIEITFPTVTEENSFNYFDFITSQLTPYYAPETEYENINLNQ
ncbi:hypothetical protein [Vallitalea okinawensis]|uniref:hypothetical protein n=1 Tax=Vallitalea okinawensis TaxID=2078660 RepID=UPI000CFD6854|nr:hypothetical protein [Vallitalea okinawensis]